MSERKGNHMAPPYSSFRNSLSNLAPIVIVCLFSFPVHFKYAFADYSEETALSALNFSKVSYCNADLIRNWTCAACRNESAFVLKGLFENKTEGTLAFAGTSEGKIVVAFRGSLNIANWVDDIKYWGTPYPNASCENCLVHRGFFDAFESLRAQVRQALHELIVSEPNFPVLITGHSLGGALALLTAVDLMSSPPVVPSLQGGNYPSVQLYTFGKPRVGNPAFVQWVKTLFRSGSHESYRAVHRKDIVPHLPPLFMGYVHAPHELWFKYDDPLECLNCSDMDDINFSTGSVGEDYCCSDSLDYPSVADHLMYLGVCTGCACDGPTTASIPGLNISWETRQMLAKDRAYAQRKRSRKSCTVLRAVDKPAD